MTINTDNLTIDVLSPAISQSIIDDRRRTITSKLERIASKIRLSWIFFSASLLIILVGCISANSQLSLLPWWDFVNLFVFGLGMQFCAAVGDAEAADIGVAVVATVAVGAAVVAAVVVGAAFYVAVYAAVCAAAAVATMAFARYLERLDTAHSALKNEFSSLSNAESE